MSKMYLQHFGLKFDPLGKSNIIELAQSKRLEQQLNGLLETRGLAVITGDSGTGKTTALRYWSNKLNPLTHQVIYQSDTHFRSFDVYSQLAENLGLENYYRFSKLWRDLKQSLIALYHDKNVQVSVLFQHDAHAALSLVYCACDERMVINSASEGIE